MNEKDNGYDITCLETGTTYTTDLVNTALAAAQKELVNPKKTQQAYGYKYAGLDQIEEMVNSVFPKHGLSHVQDVSAEFTDVGQVVTVQTHIRHKSGQCIVSSRLPMLVEQGKGMSLNQSVGAVITYARRYQLSAFLGIAAEEDTDLQEQKAAKDDKAKAASARKKAAEEKKKAISEESQKKLQSTLIDRVKARLIDTGCTAYAKAKGFDPDEATMDQLEWFMNLSNQEIAQKVDAWEAEQAQDGSKAA